MNRVLPIWYDLLFEIRSKGTIISTLLTVMAIASVVIAITLVLGLTIMDKPPTLIQVPAEEEPTPALVRALALPEPTMTPTPMPKATPTPTSATVLQNNLGCPSPGWAELWLYNVNTPAGWDYKHAVYEDPPLGWTYDVCVDCYSFVGVIVKDIDEGAAFYGESPYIDRIGVWRFVDHDGKWRVTNEREPPLIHTIWPDSWDRTQVFKHTYEGWVDALERTGSYRLARLQVEQACPE